MEQNDYDSVRLSTKINKIFRLHAKHLKENIIVIQ